MHSKRVFSTEAELANLTAIDGKDTVYRDAKTTGLCVRISCRTGRKTFFYEYRPPGCRHATKRNLKKIATLKEARLRVSGVRAELAKGADTLTPEPTRITVAALVERFMALRDPKNVDHYNLKHRILPAFGHRMADTIKTHEVTAWHRTVTKTVRVRDETGKIIGTKQVPAPLVADRALDTFKAMMNWAERQELKPRHTNPCEFVDRNFSQLELEREYEWEDVELARLAEILNRYEQIALKAHAEGQYMVAVRRPDGTIIAHYPSAWPILALRFLIMTGVRKNEALGLRWDQVKEDRQVIEWVRNYQRQETKAIGGGQRVMLRAITEPLHLMLQKLKSLRHEDNPYVFAGEYGRGQLTEINRIWYRIRDEAGLVKADGKRPRLHDLRHFYGQMAADAGLHEKQIMALMGHSTTRMSARYSKYGREARSILAETVASRISEKIPL